MLFEMLCTFSPSVDFIGDKEWDALKKASSFKTEIESKTRDNAVDIYISLFKEKFFTFPYKEFFVLVRPNDGDEIFEYHVMKKDCFDA